MLTQVAEGVLTHQSETGLRPSSGRWADVTAHREAIDRTLAWWQGERQTVA